MYMGIIKTVLCSWWASYFKLLVRVIDFLIAYEIAITRSYENSNLSLNNFKNLRNYYTDRCLTGFVVFLSYLAWYWNIYISNECGVKKTHTRDLLCGY